MGMKLLWLVIELKHNSCDIFFLFAFMAWKLTPNMTQLIARSLIDGTKKRNKYMYRYTQKVESGKRKHPSVFLEVQNRGKL